MVLVTEGKWKINQLGFETKTSEYVYFHRGQEIWREKGDKGLLNYFNYLRATYSCVDEEKIKRFPIWIKYEESCNKYN